MPFLNSTQLASELGISTTSVYRLGRDLPAPDIAYGQIRFWDSSRVPEIRETLKARKLARKQDRASKKGGDQ